VYYHGEIIALYGGNSYVQSSGSINYYMWYINGEKKLEGPGATSYNHTVVMQPGLAQQQLTIRLEVLHSNGQWDSKTITRTEKQKPGQHYYLTDHLGSVRATVNAAGTLIGWDDFYPFGMVMPGRSSNSANPNDLYKFTGHERDREAGLEIDFMNARTYDSEIGRFLQRDPHAANYPGISPYVYVANNPVIYIDPDGRDVRCLTREDCQRAADDINAAHENHEGESNITVVETEWTVRSGFFSLGRTTVQGFKLSIDDSEFDFDQDKYTMALRDVIQSDKMHYGVEYVPGDEKITTIHNGTAYNVMGSFDGRVNGGIVRISADGNQHGVPNSIVIMHELIGHGHPVGSDNRLYGANSVSQHYQRKLRGYYPVHDRKHLGTDRRIKWN